MPLFHGDDTVEEIMGFRSRVAKKAWRCQMSASDTYLDMLRADLPHAPNQVLNEWLVPYADMLGWPPSPDCHSYPSGRWEGILSRRPVAFWAQVRWREESSPLEFGNVDAKSQSHLYGLRDAHVFDRKNAYSEITDGKQRIKRIMSYVLQHGTIPSAVILLDTGLQLDVIDGHHRLVVYFLNRDPMFRQALPQGIAQFDPTLHKWIGRFHGNAA